MVSEKNASKSSITENQVSDVLFWGLGGWVVLARLGYSFAAPDVLFQNPLNLVSLNTYQFDGLSGLVGFFLAVAIYSNRKRIPFRIILDVLTPFFLCVAAGYALYNACLGRSLWIPGIHPMGDINMEYPQTSCTDL